MTVRRYSISRTAASYRAFQWEASCRASSVSARPLGERMPKVSSSETCSSREMRTTVSMLGFVDFGEKAYSTVLGDRSAASAMSGKVRVPLASRQRFFSTSISFMFSVLSLFSG